VESSPLGCLWMWKVRELGVRGMLLSIFLGGVQVTPVWCSGPIYPGQVTAADVPDSTRFGVTRTRHMYPIMSMLGAEVKPTENASQVKQPSSQDMSLRRNVDYLLHPSPNRDIHCVLLKSGFSLVQHDLALLSSTFATLCCTSHPYGPLSPEKANTLQFGFH
jgi:hypothetical protein